MPSSFSANPLSLLDSTHLLQIPDYPSEDEIFLFEYAGGVYSLFCTSGNVYMRPVGAKSGETTTLLAGEATKFGVVRYGQYLVIAYATGSKREVQRLVKIDLEDELEQTVIDSVSIAGLTNTGYCPAVAQDPTTPDNIVWLCGCESTPAEIAAGTPHFYDVNLRAGTISAASFTTIETYTYNVLFEPTDAAICVNPGGSFCYFLKNTANEILYLNKVQFGDCLDASNAPKVVGCTPAAAENATWAYSATNGGGYLLTVRPGKIGYAYLTEKTAPSVDFLGFDAGDTVEVQISFLSSKFYHSRNRWENAGTLVVGRYDASTGRTEIVKSVSLYAFGKTEFTTAKVSFTMPDTTDKIVMYIVCTNNDPKAQVFTAQVRAISVQRPRPAASLSVKSRYKADMAVGTGADTTPAALFPDADRLFFNGIFSDEADTAYQIRFVDATPAAEDATVALFGTVRPKATILAVAQKAGAYYSVSAASGAITPTALTSFPKSGLIQFTADVMYPQFPVAPVSELYERNVYFFRMRNTVSSGQAALSDVVCALYPQVGG